MVDDGAERGIVEVLEVEGVVMSVVLILTGAKFRPATSRSDRIG